MPSHRVVHFEIPADDPEGLTKFYSELFDWEIRKAPDFDYWLCDSGEGDGIGGAIMKRQAPQHSVTNYVQVESIDESSERAASLGATVTVSRQAVPGMGWFAQIVDPQGNVLGIWQDDPSAA